MDLCRHIGIGSITLSIISLYLVTAPIFADEAPNTALYDMAGRRHVLYAILDTLPDGGIALLNFTSVHCKPCKKEIPELLNIVGSSKKAKLLCIYAEAAHETASHAKDIGVYYYSYVDAFGSVRAKYNVKKFPVTIVVNKERQVLGRFEGYTPKNIAAIRNLVEP